MLPDISKRKKLFGYNKKDYESQKLHELLAIKEHDGVTTKQCVPVVQAINTYNERALELTYELTALFIFLLDIYNREFDENVNPVIKSYMDNYGGNIGESIKSVRNVFKSVAKQRKFFDHVKYVVKQNKINNEWAEIIIKHVKQADERIDYIRKSVVQGIIEGTPLQLAEMHLKSKGSNFIQAMHSFNIFDPDELFNYKYKTPDLVVPYCNYILNIIEKESHESYSSEYMKETKHKMELRERRIREKEIEEEKLFNKQMKQLEEDALSFCGYTCDLIKTERKGSLQLHADRGAHVIYAIVCGRVKGHKNLGWLVFNKTANTVHVTNRVDLMGLFQSKKEADEMVEKFLADNKDKGGVALEVEIDLNDYILKRASGCA